MLCWEYLVLKEMMELSFKTEPCAFLGNSFILFSAFFIQTLACLSSLFLPESILTDCILVGNYPSPLTFQVYLHSDVQIISL